MFATPSAVLFGWIRGLLSVTLIVAGVTLVAGWYFSLPAEAVQSKSASKTIRVSEEANVASAARPTLSPWERVQAWRPAADATSAMLAGGLLLLLISLAGRFIHPGRLFSVVPSEPESVLAESTSQTVVRPDGTRIHMQIRGTSEKPTVVLTHGWSLSLQEWDELQRDWGTQFRVVTWDLPGHGKSTRPGNRDFSLEKMARDLLAVIEASGSDSIMLMGHSIGGMITLKLCQLFPELVGTRITKLVLVHTTFQNPLRTMTSGMYSALQKPVIEPLLYLQILLSPLVRVMNLLSYWNGSVHSSIKRNGFGSRPNWSKVDFIARQFLAPSPAVLARGSFGMLAYDVSDALSQIPVPVFVVAGEQDPVTSVDASRTIKTNVQKGSMISFEDARHFGLLDCHGTFARKTAEFFRANTERPAKVNTEKTEMASTE